MKCQIIIDEHTFPEQFSFFLFSETFSCMADIGVREDKNDLLLSEMEVCYYFFLMETVPDRELRSLNEIWF